jgi:hypothetical protein
MSETNDITGVTNDITYEIEFKETFEYNKDHRGPDDYEFRYESMYDREDETTIHYTSDKYVRDRIESSIEQCKTYEEALSTFITMFKAMFEETNLTCEALDEIKTLDQLKTFGRHYGYYMINFKNDKTEVSYYDRCSEYGGYTQTLILKKITA